MRTAVCTILTILSTLACAACALQPAPRQSVEELGLDVPDSWASRGAHQGGVDGEWIGELGGAQLEELVAEARRANPDLAVAAARLSQARAQGRIAESSAWPDFDLRFEGQRQRQNFVGLPFDPGAAGGGDEEAFAQRNNTFRLLGELQWELDVWGRIRAARRAALADFQVSQAELKAAHVSLEAEVARAWFALAEARQQRELAANSLKAFRTTEGVLTRRFEAGDDRTASAAQIRLARTQVAEAEANLAARERWLDEARRRLELLLGRYPSAEIAARASLPDPPPSPPAGLPSELLLRRPDLIAAEHRFAAADQRRIEAERALFPTLRLTANAGTSTDALEDLLNSDYGVWSLAGGVVQPILRGGEIRAQMDAREAAEAAALAELQGAVLEAFGEVEQALGAERWLQRQEAALREAVEQAEGALRSARTDYAEVGGDLLTLLEAQRTSLTLHSRLLELRRLRLDNRVALHLALGGSFEAG